tara:strand:+ start:134 stop:700 length:567 start_codon:yes stop_codon:yes gene_type:complete
MKTKLNLLDKNLRLLLSAYTIVLGIGVLTGLVYVYLTTSMTPDGTVEQYKGTPPEQSEEEFEGSVDIDEDFDFEEDFEEEFEKDKIAKSFLDLISHVHQHIIIFSFIFLSMGLIFINNSIIRGRLKLFLIIEPFISIILTFGGFFILRYLTPSFVYVIIISSMLMYICFYIMMFVSLYDLLIKNESKK